MDVFEEASAHFDADGGIKRSYVHDYGATHDDPIPAGDGLGFRWGQLWTLPGQRGVLVVGAVVLGSVVVGACGVIGGGGRRSLQPTPPHRIFAKTTRATPQGHTLHRRSGNLLARERH
jgi:hypothetical protein